MKRTTYVIIAAILIVFAIGIGLAVYVASTSTPYTPMTERVQIEEAVTIDNDDEEETIEWSEGLPVTAPED